MKKIGIFSGVFDPVHKGHIGLALQAVKSIGLDEVYFMVEAKPRRKDGVTHIAHRIAMLKLAVAPYPKLHLLEFPDKQFSVAKTLPRLKHRFGNDELYFICGADMLNHMPVWELLDRMLSQMGLVVSPRGASNKGDIAKEIDKLPLNPKSVNVVLSPAQDISSGQIRHAIEQHKKPNGILPSTEKYIREHWLYALASGSSSDS